MGIFPEQLKLHLLIQEEMRDLLQFTEHRLLSVFTELCRTIILDSTAESFVAKLTDLFPKYKNHSAGHIRLSFLCSWSSLSWANTRPWIIRFKS